MNKDTDNVTHARRTVFPPDKDTLELSMWVTPPRCGGCDGRVDTFYRYDRPDDARCSECGVEWVIDNE